MRPNRGCQQPAATDFRYHPAMAPADTSKILRVGLLSPVRTLNPVDAVDNVSHLALAQIYEPPYALPLKAEEPLRPRVFDGPLKPEPFGPPGQTWSAGITAGTLFSDGTPVTAAHVAKCLSRVQALTREARIEARGERVLFSLNAPNPRFDLALTLSHSSVLLEKGGQLLGTGPFMVAPGSTMDRLRLVRNPRYRRPVAIEEVHFEVLPVGADGRPDALIKALEAGSLDFTTMLSRNDATAAQGVRKNFRSSNATAILHLNTRRPALANRTVRRAITTAIDRKALTEISYSNALAFTATSLIPSGMGTTPDKYTHDPAKAKEMLDVAGIARPLKLEMLTVWAPRPYLPNPQPVAAAIVRQLAAIGVELTISQPKDSHEFGRRQERGEYDLVLAGWIADTPDPADYLEANLHSAHVRQVGHSAVGSCNLSRVQNADLDLDLRRFREAPSPETLGQVLTRVAEEALLLPIMYGPTVVVSSFRLQNVEIAPLGMPEFASFQIE